MNFLSEKLTYYRKRAGINQSELAKKIGITPAQISKYERGIAKPRPNVISKLAKELNINISDLTEPVNNDWIDLIKAKMKHISMSQYELAEKLSCTQGAVAHWLSGRRQPSIDVIDEIFDAVGLNFDPNLFSSIYSPKQNSSYSEHRFPVTLKIKAEIENKKRVKEIIYNLSPSQSFELVEETKKAIINFLQKDNFHSTEEFLAISHELHLTSISLIFASDDSND